MYQDKARSNTGFFFCGIILYMFTYKHRKTGKIITRKTPMPASKKNDYILVGWIRNMMMKAQNIIKK